MKDSYTRSQDDFFKRFLDGIKYYVLLSIILGIVALILALLMAPMVRYFISAAYIAAIIIGVLFLGGIIFFVMFALGEICVSLSDIQKTLSMNSAERQKDEEAKDEEDEEDDSSESSSGKVKITAHTLNVRQGASRSSSVLGTLSEGEVVAYSKAKNGWLQISFRGEEGWIMQEFTQTIAEM